MKDKIKGRREKNKKQEQRRNKDVLMRLKKDAVCVQRAHTHTNKGYLHGIVGLSWNASRSSSFHLPTGPVRDARESLVGARSAC